MPAGGRRGGGGAGAGGGRRGGKAGAKAKPAEAAPPSWQSLIGSSVLFCNLVCEIDEEAAEVCEEQAAIFSSAQKKKLQFEHRIGILDAITNVVQDYMESLVELDEEKQEEHQIGTMLEGFYTAILNYFIEVSKNFSTEGGAEENEHNKMKQNKKQQCYYDY